MYIRPWLLFGKERMCIYVLGSYLVRRGRVYTSLALIW